MDLCTVENCIKPLIARGLCHMHYWRFKKYGTTDTPTKRPKLNTACTVKGCKNTAKARQLCDNHYHMFSYNGTLQRIQPHYNPTCSVENCEEPHHSNGLCHLHYQRKLKYGSTDKPKRQYSNRKRNQKHYRRLMSEKLGRPLKKGEHVHHKDGNELNNDPDNLEALPHWYHISLHIWEKYGNTATHKHCPTCKELKPREVFKGKAYCSYTCNKNRTRVS